MKLTANNVESLLLKCLANEGDPNIIVVQGIVRSFAFNKPRIDEHKDQIYELLKQLPPEFMLPSVHPEGGGGWTFLNACVTNEGVHWGEHPSMELLLVLGLAADKVKILMPREHWHLFPGGVPYFVVT